MDRIFRIESRRSSLLLRPSCVCNGVALHVGNAIPPHYQEQLKEIYEAAKIIKNPKVFVSNLQQALQMSFQVEMGMGSEA